MVRPNTKQSTRNEEDDDVDYYPVPDARGIKDPYLREVWNAALKELDAPTWPKGDSNDDDSDEEDDDVNDVSLSTDARGRRHRGKGRGGGQFMRKNDSDGGIELDPSEAEEVEESEDLSEYEEVDENAEGQLEQLLTEVEEYQNRDEGDTTSSNDWGDWNDEGINTKEDIADLLGLHEVPGARISSVYYNRRDNELEIYISHPEVHSWTRSLQFVRGKKVIYNATLMINDNAPPGLGRKIFTAQVEGAIAAGFDYIETHAAGDYASVMSGLYNGYYTWAMFGYDESIASVEREDRRLGQRIRDAFPDAKSVLDIIQSPDVPNLTKEQAREIREKAAAVDNKIGRPVRNRTNITGADWWLVHGGDLTHARFGLTEGSRSRRQLEAYSSGKRGK